MVGATVLWRRQTPSALLRVESFPGGVAQVEFRATPTLVLYVALPQSRLIVALEGAALVGVLGLGWRSFGDG